ncbi:MAG: FmdB family zinc ribbon protein [Bryobacteraceae bacterium]
MPIYEYLCEDCGTRFEKLVRREGAELACPSCGQDHLKQELSTFAAHGARSAEPATGGCPAGMCRMPEVCGRN